MGRSGKERHLVAGLFLNLSVYLVGDTQGQGRHSACSLDKLLGTGSKLEKVDKGHVYLSDSPPQADRMDSRS